MRVVLEHTRGKMKGVHSICGLKWDGPALEFLDAVELIDNPRMREPGPVCLVACKRSFLLYRQIRTPEQTKEFHEAQR